MFRDDPKNTFLADNLHDSYLGIAVAYREMPHYAKAEEYFQKAFEVERNSGSDNVDVIRTLYRAKTHLEYGEMLMRTERLGRAEAELQTAMTVFDDLAAKGSLDPAFANDVERTRELLNKLRVMNRA